MEKANSLIETEEEASEQLTGSGALSGTVPSGTQPSRGSTSGTHPRPVKPVESGVFSGLSDQVTGDQLVDSLQSALSAASRGEAGLGSLHRSVRDASRALTSLRHAHESLGEELRVMYRGLNEVMSEKAAVERYAALLTQERDAALDAAEEARREAKREREFLLREQDRFIQLLLEEHEAELQQLRRTLNGRSSVPPAVAFQAAAPAVLVEPTTGFRIGVEVKPGERPSRPSDLSVDTIEPGTREPGMRNTPVDYLRPVEERPRAVVPLPRRDEEEVRPSGAPLARLQLASSPAGLTAETGDAGTVDPDVVDPDVVDADVVGTDNDNAEPGTERGIGERNLVLDRSIVERNLMDTMRSEVPPADAEGRARTYPPPPAVLDLDSLAAEVEGNSERPPPIRRIGSLEPKLHLKPARVPTQLLDTLVSKTGDEEPEDQS